MYALKIHKIGDSLGITLPQEVLQQLNVGEGDSVFLTETADGIQITTSDPEFEKAMKAYRKGSHKYKNALQELAKS
jgi:putative addiction module antidote